MALGPKDFDRLIDEHTGALYRTAYRLTGDAAYLEQFVEVYRNARGAMTKGPDGYLGWYGKALGLFRDPARPDRKVDVIISSFRAADVLYRTRLQRERFEDPEEYEQLKDAFILRGGMLGDAKPGLTVMHPLPRGNEIVLDVDGFEGAAYFRQSANGVPIRMGLLALVTGRE